MGCHPVDRLTHPVAQPVIAILVDSGAVADRLQPVGMGVGVGIGIDTIEEQVAVVVLGGVVGQAITAV